MSQRFSLDRQSFEQFLSAAFLVQQLQRRALQQCTSDDNQPFRDLVEIQQDIENGALDLHSILNRIAIVAQRLTGAKGAGIWLFTDSELVFRTGAGSASKDQRLNARVMSQLAAATQNTQLTGNLDLASSNENGAYPSLSRSLLVAPIYRSRSVAGALAVLSDSACLFSNRDATNTRLLAGLIAHALDKASEVALHQSVSLERAAMAKVIQRLVPSLERLVLDQQRQHHRSAAQLQTVSSDNAPQTAQDFLSAVTNAVKPIVDATIPAAAAPAEQPLEVTAQPRESTLGTHTSKSTEVSPSFLEAAPQLVEAAQKSLLETSSPVVEAVSVSEDALRASVPEISQADTPVTTEQVLDQEVVDQQLVNLHPADVKTSEVQAAEVEAPEFQLQEFQVQELQVREFQAPDTQTTDIDTADKTAEIEAADLRPAEVSTLHVEPVPLPVETLPAEVQLASEVHLASDVPLPSIEAFTPDPDPILSDNAMAAVISPASASDETSVAHAPTVISEPVAILDMSSAIETNDSALSAPAPEIVSTLEAQPVVPVAHVAQEKPAPIPAVETIESAALKLAQAPPVLHKDAEEPQLAARAEHETSTPAPTQVVVAAVSSVAPSSEAPPLPARTESTLQVKTPAVPPPLVVPQLSPDFWARRQQREQSSPKMCELTSRVSKKLRQAQSASMSAVGTASSQIKWVAERSPNVPELERKVARRLRQAHSSWSFAVSSFQTRARAAARNRVNLLTSDRARLQGLGRITGASAVLLIMVIFLVLQIRLRGASATAAAGSQSVVSAKPALAAIVSVPNVNQIVGRVRPTHLQITDDNVAQNVESLSKYEMTSLRRRAEYGDDAAAFELGMAYETGHGVTQSCAKAAEWVERSAFAGNRAAQQNLALRYQDGDGVAANEAAARKWQQKAGGRNLSAETLKNVSTN